MPVDGNLKTFDTVAAEELGILRPPTLDQGPDERPLSALCISGGGIRSATFALGAIQGLAAQGILTELDYLSTVSGGGYIGGYHLCWKQACQWWGLTRSYRICAQEVLRRIPAARTRSATCANTTTTFLRN